MWQGLVNGLLGLLNNFRADRVAERDYRDQALSAIIAATNETRIYINQFQRTGRRKLETEEKLCRLWSIAAVPLRLIDRNLAERCLQKSDYWLNPDSYSAADIARFRIGIEQIYKEAKNLL